MFCAASAHADEYHYWNPVVGERSAGLAGAYTALSDDASGLYYNPAGTAYSTDSNISASVNTFNVTNKKYENAIGAGGAWNRRSTMLAPNFFGVVQHTEIGIFGFSYAMPDSVLEDQDQDYPDPQLAVRRFNFKRDDNTYNIGPSYAAELGNSFSLGITLYYHSRKNKFVSNQYVQKTDGQYVSDNLYFQTEESGYRPILGGMYSPKDGNYSVGMTVSSTFLTSSSSFSQQTTKGDYASPLSTYTYASSGNKRVYPAVLSLGYAWFPSHSLLMTVEGMYYTAVSDATFGDRKSLVNYRAGVEYYPSEKIALRAGLFSNYANTPSANRAQKQMEHVDLFGGSLSIGYARQKTMVTLGGIYQTGSGQAQVVDAASTQTLEMNSLAVFLGTSYSF